MNPEIAEVLAGDRRWCVVHGDNREVLPTLPAVDVVLQDPPYETEAHTAQRRLKGATLGDVRLVRDAPIDDFPAITEAERLLNGAEVSRLARRWALTFCQVEGAHLWRAALVASGAHRYVRTAVYVKDDPQPQLTGDRPGMGWETMVISHSPGKPHWNGGGRCGVFHSLSGKSVDRRDGRGVHPTQKPTELMLELVELFTDPGDIVLDPFCGSGTTGVACLRLGRRFIGIEKDAKYAAVATERLRAESQGLTLRDARAGQLSLLGEP
jgi:site-specific DNA-methyltransferase (adenine-specific)